MPALSDEDIVARIGERRDFYADSTIRVSGTVPVPQEMGNRNSSLGLLEALPAELIQLTLNFMDPKSLARLAQTSRLVRSTVTALPAYRATIKHAPSLLIALTHTKTIDIHSISAIEATMRTSDCTLCGEFGPFLFIPTCERCCYSCLAKERSLRMISIRMAGLCFGVSPKDVRNIPIVLSLPGKYFVSWPVTRRNRVKLVSWTQARQLGITVHGSEDRMRHFVEAQNRGKLSSTQSYEVGWLTRDNPVNALNDRFCGMASINIPYVQKDNLPQMGLWCLGCQQNARLSSRDPAYYTWSHEKRERMSEQLRHNEGRAWLKAELVAHATNCLGALQILANAGKVTDRLR